MKNQKLNISSYFFSDTIIMVFSGSPDQNKVKVDIIKKCSLLISSLIINGIDLGLLVRGTISFGKFYREEEEKFSLIVGPAIDEAAEWYEKIEMIGVVASPSVNFNLDVEESKNGPIDKYFIKSKIPIKGEQVYNTWSVNWPIMISYYLNKIQESASSAQNKEYSKENKR